jgi:hypothetical protein
MSAGQTPAEAALEAALAAKAAAETALAEVRAMLARLTPDEPVSTP